MFKKLLAGIFCLALTALFAGVASAQAGGDGTPAEEGVCDVLVGGTPGLYGLCVAFCEAHDCEPDTSLENPFENCKPASRKILDKYNAKKQAGDSPMPCLASGECRCFTLAELYAIPVPDTGKYAQCDSIPPLTNILSTFSLQNLAQVEIDMTEPRDDSRCVFVLEDEEINRNVSLTVDEAIACTDLLVYAILSSTSCP